MFKKNFLHFIILSLTGLILCSCVNNNENNKSTLSSSSGSVISSDNSNEIISSSSTLPDIDKEEIEEILWQMLDQEVNADINLPSTIDGYDIVLTWNSNLPNIISNDGIFNKPLTDRLVTLTAQYTYLGTTNFIDINLLALGYTEDEIFASALADLQKPHIDLQNLSATLQEHNMFFNVDYEWNVAGSEYASIDDYKLYVDELAYFNGATFILTASVTRVNRTESIDFEYEIAKAPIIEPVEIRVFDKNEFSWGKISQAIGYDIEFLDLDKTYYNTTGLFNLNDYSIPTDSAYNIRITPRIVGEFLINPTEAVVGDISSLPKVEMPVFSDKRNDNNKVTLLKWDKVPIGATTIRVYVDGVLMRTIPASALEYNLFLNGIIDDSMMKEYRLTIQFVGDYITHRSSDFYTYEFEGVGNNAVRPNAPDVKLVDGRLEWRSVGNVPGYQIAFNDFFSYFYPYNVNVNTNQTISLGDIPDLKPGTYKVRVKAMSGEGGISSYFSEPVPLTITNFNTAGPSNIAVSNNLQLSWDSMTSVIQYEVNFKQGNLTKVVYDNRLDLEEMVSNGILSPGSYNITIHAWLYGINSATRTKITEYKWDYIPSPTQLKTPSNITGNHNGFTWDEVTGADHYEIILNSYGPKYDGGQKEMLLSSLTLLSPEVIFIFNENDLPMHFDYDVKIKAISANSEDNSIFSAVQTVKANLKNVATASNGAQLVSVKAGADKKDVPSGTGKSENSRIIDGNLNNNWQTLPETIVELLGLTSILDSDAQNLEIVIKFNADYMIHQFVCYWNTVNAAVYTIETSLDGENFTQISSFENVAKREQRTDVHDLNEPTKARYMKVICKARGDEGFAYHLFGFDANILV